MILALGAVALVLLLFFYHRYLQMSLRETSRNEQERFAKSAETILGPIRQSIEKVGDLQRELEKRREGAYASLEKQLEMMVRSEKELKTEAMNLSRALRSPGEKGAWGQLHLKRVLELAGLLPHCDFFEQVSLKNDGKTVRPDLVIRLPGERQIAVDAKAPLAAYLEATATSDEGTRQVKLHQHARLVRDHIKELSSKEYWKALPQGIDFVVLFLPAESSYSAALEADPELIDVGIKERVILATPGTLIAILRAVAYSWRQESLSKSAAEIAKIGADLYDRIETFNDYMKKLGQSMKASQDAYNQALQSMEARLLVSARRLKEQGAAASHQQVTAPEPLLSTKE
jgi:DNA recombination protein RmuC